MSFTAAKVVSRVLPKPQSICCWPMCENKATRWVARGFSMTPEEAGAFGFMPVQLVHYYHDLYCSQHDAERLA